jgi:hypothetical protein
MTNCSNKCVDLPTDPSNCGSCGNACSDTQTCSSGICIGFQGCPAGSATSGNGQCSPCPPGSFSAAGSSSCTLCPAGSYAFSAGSIACTGDGHIHELYVAVGGSWSHADLTELTKSTGAPPAAPYSLLTAYAWEAGGSKQVVYLTGDGHIHELYVAVGGSWSHADLTKNTSGVPVPLSDPPTIAGFEWKAGSTEQLVFPGYKDMPGGQRNHIFELSAPIGGSWSVADLTDLAKNTSAPEAAQDTPFAAYAWEAGRAKQVVYLTADGHIYELFSDEGTGLWGHADLTDLAKDTGATPVRGYP